MASFSPTEAAFEGFRLTRERPVAVLAWVAAYFVFTFAIAILTIVWVGPDLAGLRALSQATNPDPTELTRAFMKLAPFLTVVIPLQVIFFAVLNCAIYRAVLRPYEDGLAFFRLGADELRMVVLGVVLFALWLISIFAVAIVVGLAASTLGMFGGSLGALLGGLVDAMVLAATIWVFVRLSLAAPMTFDQRRLVVFGSWQFTRGSFWALMGAYGLALALDVVILVLMTMISSGVLAVSRVMTGESLAALGTDMASNVGTVRAFLTVPTIISQACGSAMITIYFIIILSPSAIAYQGLAGHGRDTAALA